MVKVEKTTVSVLIGFAIVIGGIMVGTTKPLGLPDDAAIGIIIACILIGGGLIAATLVPKMFKKR